MGEISNLNTENARFNPEGQFDDPGQLAETAGLSLGQKFATLERWRLLVQERMAATNEGMPPNGTSGRDLGLLEKIDAAQKALDIQYEEIKS
jgi:hypothetical protein